MEKDKVISELLSALRELVDLKNIKDTQGETEDYLKRKPLAWITAKRLLVQHKNHGITA